jgi:agmatinase
LVTGDFLIKSINNYKLRKDIIMGKNYTWTGVLHAGIASFLKAPIVEPKAEALISAGATHAIYGFPFDYTTITRPGSSHGPRALRDASSQYLPYHFDYDLNLADHISLVDCGDVQAIPGSAEKTFAAAEADLDEMYKAGVMPIIIGGEHSTTIPGAASFARSKKGPLGLVMFDTHLDTAPDMGGEKLTHCAPITRTLELSQFSSKNTVILGMHGPANPVEERRWLEKNGVRMYTIEEIMDRGIREVTREAMEIAWDGTEGVYLTVDLDCLDACFVPGTCAPEPGGLTSRELLSSLKIVGEYGFSAFDIAEVAPQYDLGGITARMGCRIILDLLASRIKTEKLQNA